MFSSRTAVERLLRMGFVVGLALATSVARAPGGELLALSETDSSEPIDAAAAPWRVFAVSSERSEASAGANALRVKLSQGDHASCAREIGLDASAGLVCRFNLTLSGANGDAAEQILRIGSGFSTSNVDEADASTFARLGIRGAESGRGFRLRDLASRRNSPAFDGTQAVTWALNRSGHAISYAAPDGGVETVANDRMDVWVGRSKVFDELAITRSTAPATDLKWYWGAGEGVTALDHLDVAKLEEAVAAPVAPAREPVVDATEAAAPPAGEPRLELYHPSPNPFARTTRFAYAISASSEPVEIGVFDVAGRQVRNLVRETQISGRYEVAWDGRNDAGAHVHDGIYFLRASIGHDLRVARIAYLVK